MPLPVDDRAIYRTIRGRPFPLFGVQPWAGERSLGGFSQDGLGRLYEVELRHQTAAGWVVIETTTKPGSIKAVLALPDEGLRTDGELELPLDEGTVTLVRYPGDPETGITWAAAGTVGDLGLGILAAGIDPGEVRLVSDIDPEPYLEGSGA